MGGSISELSIAKRFTNFEAYSPEKKYTLILLYFQNLKLCETKRYVYCQMYIIGHCSLTLYKDAIWQYGNMTNLPLSYTNICKGLKPQISDPANIPRQTISGIDPIYLPPVLRNNTHTDAMMMEFEDEMMNRRMKTFLQR